MSSNSIPRVAFQGERGAFSEEAAVKLLGESIELVPRMTFEALFSAVPEGAADYALAPIENSLAGSVHRSYDLLLDSPLQITAEVVLPIAHSLIAVPGAKLDDIAIVESHPVALAQCERFFQEYPRIQRIATHDTAGSVRQVTQAGDRTRAAIAGKRAAKIYGGNILREHIEDHRENYTRFLLLSPAERATGDGDKMSLMIQLSHQPGALYGALHAIRRAPDQPDENRKPPDSGPPLAIPLLSGSASFAARSADRRGTGGIEALHGRGARARLLSFG